MRGIAGRRHDGLAFEAQEQMREDYNEILELWEFCNNPNFRKPKITT